MRLSFRTILIACLITFLVGTVSLVGIVSYLSARSSAQDLSSQVMGQVASRVDGEIRALLGVAVTQSRLHARLIETGKLEAENCPQLAGFFREAMAVNDRLSFLSFGRERDGSYCHVARDKQANLSVRYLVREPDNRLSLTDFEVRGDQLVERLYEPDKPLNDPRTRPYYKTALARERPTWTESYIFIGGESGALDIPGVTYATPIIMRDGMRVGVMTADFDLHALSQFLASMRVIERGFAFVVEVRADGSRRVIAHPDPKLLTAPAPGGGRDTVDAATIADSRVRELARHITGPATQASYLDFTADGVSYVGSLHPLAGDQDVQWLVGVAVPEDDILGEVKRNLRFQVIVGILAILGAVVLAAFVAALVAQPLRALAREAADIGKFHLEAKTQTGRVTEVQQLARAVEDMKASLRSFRKFVPAELVRNLLASGQEARIGGKRQMLTVYFSDLEGFTTVSEQLPPELLVELLGEYLAAMTAQILEEGGTVDKYIGDAIMAFWGAPIPNDDHAYVACRTALRNQQKLAELREGWVKRGLPAFHVRIGLNTGEAIVGNIGSEERLDYTAIGDSVNLASRLEGLNKYFETGIMISASTYEAVKDRVVARPLDLVSVKGKAQGAMVYELIALADAATPSQIELAGTYAAAVEAYLARDWRGAIEKARRVLELAPGDRPAANLIERCEQLAAEPPGPEWDGIYRMYRK